MIKALSLIIRTKNNRQNLAKIFEILKVQDFTGELEIILVDTESRDGTVELAKENGAKIVSINQDDFSYPKSLNLGMKAASHEIVAEIVGHALPFTKSWLRSGIRHFDDPQVAGVYSPVIPKNGATFTEIRWYYPGYLYHLFKGSHPVDKTGEGVFGATNIILRRSLWEKHHFDERFGSGGEDGEWAEWALKQGYKIICEPKFVIRHSHGLGRKEFKKQLSYWSTLGQPAEFNLQKLQFRKDLSETLRKKV